MQILSRKGPAFFLHSQIKQHAQRLSIALQVASVIVQHLDRDELVAMIQSLMKNSFHLEQDDWKREREYHRRASGDNKFSVFDLNSHPKIKNNIENCIANTGSLWERTTELVRVFSKLDDQQQKAVFLYHLMRHPAVEA